jgi:hypothetical protein
MTEPEVLAIRGIPSRRGGPFWEYEWFSTVIFESSEKPKWTVRKITGQHLDIGGQTLLGVGASEDLARNTLRGLGEPSRVTEVPRCGNAISPFDKWTFGLFAKFDGSLFYPHGLEVRFSGGKVWGFELRRPGTD